MTTGNKNEVKIGYFVKSGFKKSGQKFAKIEQKCDNQDMVLINPDGETWIHFSKVASRTLLIFI